MSQIRHIVLLAALAFAACGDEPTKQAPDSGMNAVDMGSGDSGTVVPDVATPDMAAPDLPDPVEDMSTDDASVPDVGQLEVFVEPVAISVNEGEAGNFSVWLSAAPDADVTLALTNPDPTELTLDSDALVFAVDNFDVPQIVTIATIDDVAIEPTRTHTITLGPAAGGGYDGVSVPSVDITIIDSDEPGILSVSPAVLTTSESGTTASFDVTASVPPTAPVTVTAMVSDPSEGSVSGPIVLDASTLGGTFVVTGLADTIVDGDQTYQISLTAISADVGYDGAVIPAVAVTNLDAGAAPSIIVMPTNLSLTEEFFPTGTFDVVLSTAPGATVTIDAIGTNKAMVSPAQVAFDDTNFGTPQTFTVTALDDDIASGNQVHTITTTATATGVFAGINPPDVNVLIQDLDTAEVNVSPTVIATTEGGTTATFSVVLNSEPTADVAVAVLSSDAGEGLVAPTMMTFTSATWNVPQIATVTGVDDPSCDGDISYPVTVFATSADTTYDGLMGSDVIVTNIDDDSPAFIVEPLTVQHTSESGTSITVDVSLNCPTTEDVTIPVSSTNTAEGTVAPTSLTFTSGNSAVPQTLTVTGVDDAVTDGPVQFAIVLDPATSADLSWNALDPPNFSVINDDNEPGFTVMPTTLTVAETGSTAFTVVLNVAPIANVRIDIIPDGELADEYTLSTQQLVFTPANWMTARTVTVSGVPDAMNDGAQTWALGVQVGATIDPGYAADCTGNCPAQTVNGTTTD